MDSVTSIYNDQGILNKNTQSSTHVTLQITVCSRQFLS